MKLARERRRVEKAKECLARQAARDAQQRQRLGPVEVVDPQGRVVTLRVVKSGTLMGPAMVSVYLFGLAVSVLFALASLVSHRLVFRGGSTVEVKVRGGKQLKVRMKSQDAAADCLQEIAEAVRRDGVAGVGRWRRPAG